MAFPPSFLARLKAQTVLSDVIGSRVPLKKHGREHTGLCPFHKEKSPSFTVNDEKGFYHCFGCSAHGDAIEFLKLYDRMGYREAVEYLAREARIPVPELTPESKARIAEEQSLYTVVGAACQWYERQFASEGGMQARGYLEGRGITPDTRAQFRIGYAPDSRSALKNALIAQGFNEQQLLIAGLLARSEQGETYDRFRARLIFPIRDTQGRVIAFGGRLIQPHEHAPKYLNSSETPLFKKGEILYNLDQAGRNARSGGHILIVEGYMDVVACAQGGVSYAVATLGTAVTREHLLAMWRLVDMPTMCLDGDAAGIRASLRAAELALPLLTPGKSLSFTTLPAGEDPDSVIRAQGAGALTQAIAKARDLHTVLWERISADFKGSAPTMRAGLEKKLMTLADSIEDMTVRSHTRSFFRDRLWQSKPKEKNFKTKAATIGRSSAVEALAHASHDAMRLKTARQILKIVLKQPMVILEPGMEERIGTLDCVNVALCNLRDALIDTYHRLDGEFSDWNDITNATQFAHVVSSLFNDKSAPIPEVATASAPAAAHWVNRLLDAHDLSLLEAEYQKLHSEWDALKDNEAFYSRLLALQEELKERKRKRQYAYEENV